MGLCVCNVRLVQTWMCNGTYVPLDALRAQPVRLRLESEHAQQRGALPHHKGIDETGLWVRPDRGYGSYPRFHLAGVLRVIDEPKPSCVLLEGGMECMLRACVMAGRTDGWMDGRTDGWMDGCCDCLK